jgi:hypothetical protein
MAKMDPRFSHCTAWEPAPPERRSFAIRQVHHRKQPCKEKSGFGRNAYWTLLPLLDCSKGWIWNTLDNTHPAAGLSSAIRYLSSQPGSDK